MRLHRPDILLLSAAAISSMGGESILRALLIVLRDGCNYWCLERQHAAPERNRSGDQSALIVLVYKWVCGYQLGLHRAVLLPFCFTSQSLSGAECVLMEGTLRGLKLICSCDVELNKLNRLFDVRHGQKKKEIWRHESICGAAREMHSSLTAGCFCLHITTYT